MPVDWITLIHKERMNNKPHTEAAKEKMSRTHKVNGQTPERRIELSEAGKKSWATPESRATLIAAQKAGWVKRALRLREEQDQRNQINRARVEAHLKGIK